MDRLVQRIRWSMNLTFVASLLVFWGLAQEDVDIMGAADAVMEHAEPLGVAERGFMQFVPGAFGELMWGDAEAAPPRDLMIRATPVRDVIGIQFGLTDQLSEILTEGERGAAFGHFVELKSRLQELESAFNRSGLDAGTTIGRWIDVSTNRVRIPIIDERVDVQTAMIVLSLASNTVWLYLLSCVVTLRRSAMSAHEAPQNDWVFLHHGPIGPLLGIGWVCVPLAALGYGVVKYGVAGSGLVVYPLLLTLALISAGIVFEAFRVRALPATQALAR